MFCNGTKTAMVPDSIPAVFTIKMRRCQIIDNQVLTTVNMGKNPLHRLESDAHQLTFVFVFFKHNKRNSMESSNGPFLILTLDILIDR